MKTPIYLNPNTNALVLFSGGQDSTTCLAWALERFSYVETVGFEYGQRHSIEMTCRQDVRKKLLERWPQWSDRLGMDHVINLNWLGEILATGLTRGIELSTDATGRPNTFVPGRNLIFLTVAAALADTRKLQSIVGGMCEADNSGYPDCRDDTIKALQVALNLGMDAKFILETPLMWLSKAATWKLAENIGGEALIRLIVEETHTCYLGDRTNLHEWGWGCGRCPACDLRADGFLRFKSGHF